MKRYFLAGLLLGTQISLALAQTLSPEPSPFEEAALSDDAVVAVFQQIGVLGSANANATVTAVIVQDPASLTKLMKGVRFDLQDGAQSDSVYLGESQMNALMYNIAQTSARILTIKKPVGTRTSGIMNCRGADRTLRTLCPGYRISRDWSGLDLRIARGHIFSLPGRAPSDLAGFVEKAAAVLAISLDDARAKAPSGPTPPADRIHFRSKDEVEPNDDFLTANSIDFPTLDDPDNRVGITVRGSVSDQVDFADTVAFTTPRTERYFFKLCENHCRGASVGLRGADGLDVGIAYFEVLDAGGNALVSTKANKPRENYTALCLRGGERFYVRVVAGSTENVAQQYRISATEQPIRPVQHRGRPNAKPTTSKCDPTLPSFVPRESYAVLIGSETTLSHSPTKIDVSDASIVGSRSEICLALGAGALTGEQIRAGEGSMKAEMDQLLGDVINTVLVTDGSGEQREYCGPSPRWTAKGIFAGKNEISACYRASCKGESLSLGTEIEAVTLSSSQPVTILGAYWHSTNRSDAH